MKELSKIYINQEQIYFAIGIIILIIIIKLIIYIFKQTINIPQKIKKLIWNIKCKKGQNIYKKTINKEINLKKDKIKYPFELKEILNKDEINLYKKISDSISKKFTIIPKINLKNILKVDQKFYYENNILNNNTLNEINDITIDFIILEEESLKPILLIIEKEKWKNYKELETISNIINIDIEYITFKELYNEEELKNKIYEKIGIK